MDGGLLDAWAQWWAGKDTKDLTLAGVRLLWWGRGGKLLQFAGGLTVAIDLIGEARLRLWLDAARARSADALSRFRELPQVLADVHAARLARYRRFVTPLWFAITALCVWWLLDTAGPGWPIYSWVVAVAAALGTVLTFRDRPGGTALMYAAAAMAIFPLLPEETRVEAWDLKYGRVFSADAFLSYYQVVGTTVLFLAVAAVVGFAVRFVARVLYPVLFTAVFGVVAVPRWVGSGVVSVVLGGVVRVLAVVPRTSVRWVALGAILVGFHFDLLTS